MYAICEQYSAVLSGVGCSFLLPSDKATIWRKIQSDLIACAVVHLSLAAAQESHRRLYTERSYEDHKILGLPKSRLHYDQGNPVEEQIGILSCHSGTRYWFSRAGFGLRSSGVSTTLSQAYAWWRCVFMGHLGHVRRWLGSPQSIPDVDWALDSIKPQFVYNHIRASRCLSTSQRAVRFFTA